MTHTETLRLALEALENWLEFDPENFGEVDKKAITAIEAVLEAKDEPWEKFCDSNCVWTDHHPDCRLAKDEPVAYLCENAVGHKYFRWKKPSSVYKPIALYTTPPQRTWVGLTNDEVNDFAAGCHLGNSVQGAIYKAEAKLKEKNT
jgi:hypothetical protein